jgi:hypothetical protein
MNKPHVHAEVIKAWADGAEIEVRLKDGEWELCNQPLWWGHHKYRVKPQPVIKKMRMHYDSIEKKVAASGFDGMNVPQQMWTENRAMGAHLEFTFTDGKLTSVEIINR